MILNFVRKNESYLLKITQLILGCLFVISGFLKGVDPMGVSYKLNEYFVLFGMDFFLEWSIGFAIALCAFEIFIGIMLLTGICKKVVSILALLFMSVFTIITFYLYIDPAAEIQECGCFGDAVHLTNAETFFKNVIFILLTIFYTWRQFKIGVPSSSSKKVTIIVLCYVVTISLFIPLYSSIFLPPFDFLPFNRGVNVLENIRNYSDNQGEITMIYRNKQNGKTVKFDLADTTWQDATIWDYVDTETTKEKGQNPLSRFTVIDKNSNDVTSDIFGKNDSTFIIIAQQIDALTETDFEKMNSLYQFSQEGFIRLSLFTSSDITNTENILEKNNLAGVAVYNVDQTVLKAMLRNPKGVLMFNDGVLNGKWNLKQNSFSNLSRDNLYKLIQRESKVITIYWVTILLLVLGLVCLVFLSVKKKRDFNKSERSVNWSK